MISTLFCKVINMGITGSIAILVVMLARQLLRRQPKKYSYLLWLVVIFRLLCPVSISSALSLYSVVKPVSENASIEYFSPQELAPIVLETTEKVDSESADNVVIEVIERKVDYLSIAAFAWLTVGCGLMGKNIHTYLYLKRRLQNSRKTGVNTYKNSYISSAFVIGCLRPKIYLPENITPNEEEIVVMHEQQHIKSRHTYAKLLAFTALCLHWFNPLVWLAYSLFEKDMEMACDEAVIRQLGHKAKADYSQALLSISIKTGNTRYLRLAFSENEVKERVVNIMNIKELSAGKIIGCTLGLLAVSGMLIFNPVKSSGEETPATISPVETQKVYHKTADEKIVCFSFQLPEGWAIDNSEDMICIYDDNEVLSGYVQCINYKEYESSEREPAAIYSDITMSHLHFFDTHVNYKVIKSYENREVALTTVYTADEPLENIAILAYDRDYLSYIAIELFQDKIAEDQAKDIALSMDIKSLEQSDLPKEETPKPTPEVIIAAAIEPTAKPIEEPNEKTAGEPQRDNCYEEAPEPTAEPVQTTTPTADIDLSFTVDDLLGGDYRITRGFTGQYADGGHDGLDFSAPYGTPIKALEDGVVLQAYYTSRGYGNYIAIDHGDYVTHYSHCSKLGENIQMGDTVKKGDVIAYVGSTGNSTGNHLHLEVRKKSNETGLSSGYTRIDPAKFMK